MLFLVVKDVTMQKRILHWKILKIGLKGFMNILNKTYTEERDYMGKILSKKRKWIGTY